MLPWPRPPPIFVLNVVFGKQHPVPKWCDNFVAHVHVWRRQLCFERKSNICIAKFGILGVNGVKGSKFLVKNVIFGIADPDLPIHYANFIELRWWLRVVYSWAPPSLSIFTRKKQSSVFWAKIWQFWEINSGLILNLNFITPKRHPCVISRLMSYCA